MHQSVIVTWTTSRSGRLRADVECLLAAQTLAGSVHEVRIATVAVFEVDVTTNPALTVF